MGDSRPTTLKIQGTRPVANQTAVKAAATTG